MATNTKPLQPIIILDRMVAQEKVSTAKLEQVLEILSADQIHEWAEALEAFATSLSTVEQNFDTWQFAEGREEKSDARDELLEAMEEVVSHSYTIDELPDIDALRLGGGVTVENLLTKAAHAETIAELLTDLDIEAPAEDEPETD